VLDVVNLECTRGDRALFRGLSFRLDAGEMLHVTGRNGSGKTTLLRTLCGLFLPDAGEVRWKSRNIRSLKEDYCREFVYLGHQTGIKDELSALENLRISTALHGEALTEAPIREALADIGLRACEDFPTKMLSQGQKRRVALARLLLTRAPLWVLDEPFTALDSTAVEYLQSIIGRHVARGGLVILTSHQRLEPTAGKISLLHLDVLQAA
jgi:heme exporter protein A